MAIIRAFSGIRPRKGLEAQIAALPYDVYSRAEAKAEVEKEPLSFLRIDRAETGFDDSVDTYDPKVYQRAHDLLWSMVDEGQFVRDQKPCFYLYEQTREGRTQTGLVACASIDDYENGVIRRHENTVAEKEADRIRHVDVCNAQTGPIFLAYRRQQRLQEIFAQVKQAEAEFDFITKGGIRHRGWQIANEGMVREITEIFAAIGSIYIADGHHRAASAVCVGERRRERHNGYTGDEEFNYFLSVLFPGEELTILDYNRVVKDLNGHSREEFLKMVGEKFLVEKRDEAYKPKEKGKIGMYLKGQWYELTVREEYLSSDPVEGLDVAILQRELLTPVLGIADPKRDKRIAFVGGIRGLAELERRVQEDCEVAFSMYPTAIEELYQVADAGRLMPPKSTWFEPKLLSGLFIHELDG